MASKWFLDDWEAPQRILVGALTDVHRSDSDDDSCLIVSPDPDHQALLVNRLGETNAGGLLECEVNVGSAWRDAWEGWARSLVGSTVTAQGVWVDDIEHASKTELHPLDIVYAAVSVSALTDDWIGSLAAAQQLAVGESLNAVRFAAASDIRDGDLPPLCQWTRPVRFSLLFPPMPNAGTPAATSDYRLETQANSTIATTVRQDASGSFLDVTITCLARDFGGPGALTGEIVTYWGAPRPAFAVTPEHLSFGSVAVHDVAERTVKIRSSGNSPLTLTLAAAPLTGVFHWPALHATVTPGATAELTVEFSPHGVGTASSTLQIGSNAGTIALPLQGTGTKAIQPL